MKPLIISAFLVSPLFAADPGNPHIDSAAYRELVARSMSARESARVTEDEFIRLSAQPGTIILDARTKDKFDNIHIKGAVHLAFTDFTEEALARVIPNKDTRILIYCNNNFFGDAFNLATKFAPVSLNVQTFANLRAYGYTNIRELGPYLDIRKTRIPFEGKTIPSPPQTK